MKYDANPHCKSLKIPTAALAPHVAYSSYPDFGHWRVMMLEKTCAACDCKLDANSIKVRIGGRTVEVCCEACSRRLKEAHISAGARHRSDL
jgi:hypothetical protein